MYLFKRIDQFDWVQIPKIEFNIGDKKYVILGTTLFSNVEPDNYAIMATMSDFKYIYKNQRIAWC